MEIPKNIVAGDSAEWLDILEDYPSPEWSLRYVLVCPEGKIELDSVAESETEGHLFAVTAETTAPWVAGLYSYQAYAIADDKRKTVARGLLNVEVDYSSKEKYDARPLLDQEIEAVENAKLGRASSTQLAMEIDGSRIEHISRLDHDELLERLYKRRAIRDRARAIANGESPFWTVRCEFNGI